MIPAAFDYKVADSSEAAIAMLGEYGDEAKLLAGGHSLIPIAVLIGLVLGYLTVRSGSLWPAVLCHGVNNASALLAGKLAADSPLQALHDPEADGR